MIAIDVAARRAHLDLTRDDVPPVTIDARRDLARADVVRPVTTRTRLVDVDVRRDRVRVRL